MSSKNNPNADVRKVPDGNLVMREAGSELMSIHVSSTGDVQLGGLKQTTRWEVNTANGTLKVSEGAYESPANRRIDASANTAQAARMLNEAAAEVIADGFLTEGEAKAIRQLGQTIRNAAADTQFNEAEMKKIQKAADTVKQVSDKPVKLR